MNLVCLGKNFGDRNFSYAWYKLKLICVLRVGLSKVSLLKWCTLVLSVVLRKYLSTLQNFSAVRGRLVPLWTSFGRPRMSRDLSSFTSPKSCFSSGSHSIHSVKFWYHGCRERYLYK